jgi:hypothetical protein
MVGVHGEVRIIRLHQRHEGLGERPISTERTFRAAASRVSEYRLSKSWEVAAYKTAACSASRSRARPGSIRGDPLSTPPDNPRTDP